MESRAGQNWTAEFPLRERTDRKTPDNTEPVIIIREGPGNLGDMHWYSAAALARAALERVFEGSHSHLDHPTPTEDREQPGRSVRSLAGFYRDVKLIDYIDPERGRCKALEGIFFPQLGKEEVVGMLRTCSEYAKFFPTKSYIGLSINAYGDGTPTMIEGQEWNRVDHITHVESVDLVTRAGAGGRPKSLREMYRMATKPKKFDEKSLREAATAVLTDAKDKLVAALTEGDKKPTDAQIALIEESHKTVLDQTIEAAKKKMPTDEPVMDDEDEDPDELEELADKPKPGVMGNDIPGVYTDSNGDLSTVKDQNSIDPQADLAKKTPKELLDIAGHATKENARLSAELTATKSKLTEANGNAKKLTEAEKALRENRADAVVAEMQLPESYRPMLRRELLERPALVEAAQMQGFAAEWKAAYVTPNVDGAGNRARESGGGNGQKIDLKFTASSHYED